MATYVGTPWEGKPFEYRSDIPLDLVAKGLATKEAQTTAVQQQIQGYVDSLGSSQFYKDSDRQLVNDKIKSTVESLNNYAGPDLTDGRTQSQFMNTISGLSNDPDVLDRIMANKNVGRQLNKIQQLKEKHPEQYSAVNEDYFMKQVNKWRDDPNQKHFDATFKPYVDTNKWQQEAAESIAKNPDIHNEIMYATVNGQKIPRTEREIKEVTLEKLYKGMLGSMPADVRGQFELEYHNALWDNGKNVALSAVDHNIEDMQARADNLTQHLSEHSYEPSAETEARNKLQLYTDKLKDLQAARTGLADGTRKPEEFIPLSDFLSEKVMAAAKSHAYRQEKDTPDPWGLAFQKHKWDQEDIMLANQLKMKADAAKKQQDAFRTTNFAKHIDEMFTRGKAALSMDEFAALNNIDAKVDDDGYANKTFSGDDIFVDIRPMIQQVAGVSNVKQAVGQSTMLDMYNVYKQQWAAGQRPQLPYKTDENGYSWEQPVSQMAHPGTEPKATLPTYEQYVKSLANDPNIVNTFKNTYEIDLTDPNALETANKVAQVVNAHQIGNVGMVVTNVHGDAKITIGSGDNAFPGSDGLMYTAGVIKGSEVQLAALLGKDRFNAMRNSPGKDGQPLMRETGVRQTGLVKGEPKYEAIYSFDATTRPKVDVTVANDKYLNKYLGSSDYKDNAADLNNQFATKWQDNMALNSAINRPYEEYKIASGDITKWQPAMATSVTELLNRVDNPKYSYEQQRAAKIGLIQLHQLYQPKKK